MEIKELWPEWQVVGQIGEGSFGKVYEIQREEYGNVYKAALKVITIPQSQSEIQSAYSKGLDNVGVTKYFQSYVEDITKEFALMSKLKGCNNIVSYEDHKIYEHSDGIGWDILIRMELLTPLQRWNFKNPLNEADVIKLGIDICNALELCQREKIIHRDIKPENIFVNDYGFFKLGDFGIARTIEKKVSDLSKKGTFNYIAPEIYNNQSYGCSIDMYSLGMVLYEYLNESRLPFQPLDGELSYSDVEEAFQKRMKGEKILPPIYGSSLLKKTVLKAIAYYPEDRYSTATEFREALQACVKEIGEDYSGTRRLFGTVEEEPNMTPKRQTRVIKSSPEREIGVENKPKIKYKNWIWGTSAFIALLCIAALAFIKTEKEDALPTKEELVADESIETSDNSNEDASVDEPAIEQGEEPYNDVENVEQEGNGEPEWDVDIEGNVVILGKTEMLLVGDTTELSMKVGSFLLYGSSANVTWESSNEAVAKISSAGIVTAVSPGVVELTGRYNGKKSDAWEMIIAESDKNSGVSVTTDYERISLREGTSETVELTIHGTLSEEIGAACYCSSGLNMLFNWGGIIDGNRIPLNFEAITAGSEADEGDITVIIYPLKNPEKVLASATIHVKINK